MKLFKRKPKSTQLDPTQLAEHGAYLQGDSDGFTRGKQVGFDEGYSEGYNRGRADALDEFKQAAKKALAQGE